MSFPSSTCSFTFFFTTLQSSVSYHKMFSAIFGMCKDIRTYQQKEREARRKDTRTLKQIAARLELDPPKSPLSDEAASEPETEEQQQAKYNTEFAEFL